MRTRIVGAAAALGLAAGLVLTAVVAGSGYGGEDEPEPLPVLATSDSTAAGAQEEVASDAARSMAAGGVEYRYDGDLPELDDEASAWRLETGDDAEQEIAELAERLGFDDEPTREDNEGFALWRATDGERVLEVYDQPGLPWNMYDTSAQGGVSVGCAAPDCAPDMVCTEVCREELPERPADLPTEEEAEALARDLLGDSVDDAAVRVDDGITSWFVSFDPVVGGLPTIGMASGVAVGDGGAIQNASGWLTDPTEGDRYPLIGADEALRRLEEQQEIILMAPACDPGPAVDCGPVEPAVVILSGVRLGLQLMGEHLVPSYLFGGDGYELPVVAVADEFLVVPDGSVGDPDTPVQVDPPTDVPTEPAEPPSGGGGSPGSPGSGSSGSSSSSSCSASAVNELSVEVCVDGPVPVGEPVLVTITGVDPNAPVRQDCGSPIVVWGDDDGTAVCEIGCVSGGEGPGEAKTTFEHVYDEPGDYTIEVTVESNCGEPPGGRISTSVSVSVR